MDELLRERVRSEGKRAEVWAVLRAREPSHVRRLWMAGFLKFCGLSPEEAATLVGRCCAWADYDAAITWRQLCSVWGVKMPAPPRGAPELRADKADARKQPATFWRPVTRFPGWFCEGARECWVEVERATGRVARYRSVEGDEHTLLFVDLDARDGDLGPAWEAARALWAATGPWWLLKFSGRRGFHVVAKLPGAVAPAEVRALALRRVEAAGVDPGIVDWSIYTRRRLIRCVGSLHLGSGRRSAIVAGHFAYEATCQLLNGR